MKLSTYQRLRHLFPALNREETIASYFERLSKYLERVQAEWDGYHE